MELGQAGSGGGRPKGKYESTYTRLFFLYYLPYLLPRVPYSPSPFRGVALAFVT